ncbi:MAG: hypothetical protein IAE67_01375 [Candidatus Competibacteraceae bacterium]|nr:hypothetical protein [Candidatus Competibacteraceae bacterium]
MKALELFWMGVSIILLGVAFYLTWFDAPHKVIYYVFPAIGLFMYFKRRNQRRRSQK